MVMIDWILTIVLGATIFFLWSRLETSRHIKRQAQISSNRRAGESPIVSPLLSRTFDMEQKLQEFQNISSLAESFIKAVDKYRHKQYIKVKSADSKKTWESTTFDKVYREATNLGHGLLELGLLPSQGFKSVDVDLYESMVGIYMKNSYYWVLTDHACSLNSLVSVPIHATFGKEGLNAVLNHSKLSVLVTMKDKIQQVLDLKPKYLKVIVVAEDLLEEELTFITHVKILSIKDLLQGKEGKQPTLPTGNHVFTVCYTSGTTGDPKGVVLTHTNMIQAGKGLLQVVPDHLMPGVEDCHLSFLPMSHIFERMNTHALTWCGVTIGFGTGDLANLPNEIIEFKPTLFPTVPRLLTRVYSKIMEKLDSTSFLKKLVFNFGLEYKMNLLKQGVLCKNTLWDKIIFSKIAERLGGRIKFIATGAAPIDPKIINFYRAVLACEIVEGYGQTESCGTGTCTLVGDYESPWGSHVGPPFPGMLLKLVDVPSLGYFASDKPNPRGQICLSGPTIMQGYYMNQIKTDETIRNGWLYTGDIGQILPNGTVQIIDRVCNIFKLAQGEFICPEKIENKLESKYISQIVIFGNSLDNFCTALIVPEPEMVKLWAKKNDCSQLDIEELCQDEHLVEDILRDIRTVGKQNGLLGFEIPRRIALLNEPFTVESGLLTPSLKIKRKLVEKRLSHLIQELRIKL